MIDSSLGLSWKVETSKKGSPTLFLGDRAIHSHYDPVAEAAAHAKRLVSPLFEKNKDFLILIGAGLGYLPMALQKEGCPFAVLEPFPELRSSWPLIDKGSLPIWTSLENIPFGKFTEIASHPGYEPYSRLEYISLLQILHDKQQICSPSSVKETVITQRSLDMLARLPNMKTILSLQDRHQDETVFLISPGASLREALPYLKQNRKTSVMAALQAVPLLSQEGIPVDYAVVADPNDFSKFTEACDIRVISSLLLESGVDPILMDWHPEKSYLFHYSTNYLHQLGWALTGAPEIRAPLATVSETMLHLAMGMGFDEIVLIGMDFCWLEDRYSYRASGAIDSMKDTSEKRFRVKSEKGKEAWTESAYYQAARYMNQFCPKLVQQCKRIYRVGEGLPIAGTEPMDPQQLIAIGKKKHYRPEVEEKKVPIGQIEKLIRDASVSTHVLSHKTNYSCGIPLQKQMPFFDEIPVKERPSI